MQLNLLMLLSSHTKSIYMKKYFSIFTLLLLLGAAKTEAQYGTRVYVRPGYPRPAYQRRVVNTDNFIPTVNFSIGYGYPNLDKNEFLEFSHAYKGTISQNGPVIGAVDYQFSRYMSIGVMGTYGKVSVPYYDNNSNGITPSINGSLENWSVMFNLVNYFPSYNRSVSPYLRTAVGVNNWNQKYTDANGNKMTDIPDPNMFAYQVSLGARINMSPNAGIFLEAGYGKYILSGGLTVKL